MHISDALIEKYHQGMCSLEETEVIEKWLQNGDEPDFEFPAGHSKEEIKLDIWRGIHPHMVSSRLSNRSLFWNYSGMVAAALLVIVLGISYFIYNVPTVNGTGSSIAQTVSTAPTSEALTIEFGRESDAAYSQESQMLNFCGVIKITPKENMKLSLTSMCDGKKETIREILIKGGTTYFAMDIKHQHTTELIIMDKSLIAELPPILQNSLIAQFGI